MPNANDDKLVTLEDLNAAFQSSILDLGYIEYTDPDDREGSLVKNAWNAITVLDKPISGCFENSGVFTFFGIKRSNGSGNILSMPVATNRDPRYLVVMNNEYIVHQLSFKDTIDTIQYVDYTISSITTSANGYYPANKNGISYSSILSGLTKDKIISCYMLEWSGNTIFVPQVHQDGLYIYSTASVNNQYCKIRIHYLT